jgi:hypothetical protein
MKSRHKQRTNRAAARQKESQPKPTVMQVIDGLIGAAIALALLYWFFTGAWASCMSWLP